MSENNEPRGVTNDAKAREAMLERRRRAGDVLPFSPSAPKDRGEFVDHGPFSNTVPLPGGR